MLQCSVLAFAFFLPMQASRRSPTQKNPEVQRVAAIRGNEILLDDIAKIVGNDARFTKHLEQVRIGTAPTGRLARWLTQREIRNALRVANLDPDELAWTGARRVEIFAANSLVSSEEIIKSADTVIRALMQAEGEKDAQWSVVSHITDVVIPTPRSGKELVARLPSGRLGRSTAVVIVDILVDGKKVRQVALSFKLKRFREVLVALKNLKSGDGFVAENVMTKRVDIARSIQPANASPLTKLSQTRDRVARGPIRTGRIIYEKDLAMPMVIFKGDLVTVVAVVGNVRVTARGIAKKSAAIGQRIPVVIQKQKSLIPVEGIVYGTGLVIVSTGTGKSLPSRPRR